MKRLHKELFNRACAMLLTLTSTASVLSDSEMSQLPSQEERPTNGILIFLDDSEDTLRAISSGLISAIMQEAGPIIASASLIANVRLDKTNKLPRDNQKLLEYYRDVEKKFETEKSKPYEATAYSAALDELYKENDSIKRVLFGFDNATAAQNWIIKKINSSLYLLLPKKYLQQQGISVESVNSYAPQSISEVEQKLGLKVNHMKTVKVTDFEKPQPAPESADYFMAAVENMKQSKIFVTKDEYQNKKLIPSWAIYIHGHGFTDHSIADISLDDFKEFLTFLETKIYTKIFIYSSCYAAGINERIIYEDEEKGVAKTYSFAIIAEALTDAPTSVALPGITIEHENLKLSLHVRYDKFFEQITQPGIINYSAAIQSIAPTIGEVGGASFIATTPQIKFPGLSWFSVLDSNNKNVAIGSVMTKTRTTPLDIVSFFKNATPLGVLLYAENIPFELIINTQQSPFIISMVPGEALHHIKKISSSSLTAEDIINHFNLFSTEGPRKVFIIDEISAKPTTNPHGTFLDTLNNVVIDSFKQFTTYFTYKGAVLVDKGRNLIMPGHQATADEEKQYREILMRAGHQEAKAVTPESISKLQSETEKLFAKPLSTSEAIENIKRTLNTMPNNTALHIPKISVDSCPTEVDSCVLAPIKELINYITLKGDKLLRFDKFEACDGQHNCTYLTDIVYDISTKTAVGGISIYFKDASGESFIMDSKEVAYPSDDYMPEFEEEFKYFAEHHVLFEDPEKKLEKLGKQSIHKLLTPEVLAKLRDTIKAHAQKVAIKKTSLSDDLTKLNSRLTSLQAGIVTAKVTTTAPNR